MNLRRTSRSVGLLLAVALHHIGGFFSWWWCGVLS